MKEIARKAGVSIATVSMSLADYPHVNEQTKQRVRQVCRQMGYRRLRRRPAEGRSRDFGVGPKLSKIGFILLGRLLERQTNQVMFHELTLAASREGIRIEVQCLEDPQEITAAEPRLVEFAASMEGVVLSGLVSAGLLAALEQREIPHVLYGSALGSDDVAPGRHGQALNFDAIAMGERAASILLEQGHRRIGFLCGMLPKGLFNDRWLRGYRHALLSAGVAPDERLIQVAHSSSGIADSAAEAFLALPERPTAYTIPAVDTAAAFIKAMQKRGVEVAPQSIVLGGSPEQIQQFGVEECRWIEAYNRKVPGLLLRLLGQLYLEPMPFSTQLIVPFTCH
jgi:DNA-binding LacI/PurR family transcriptional regulator